MKSFSQFKLYLQESRFKLFAAIIVSFILISFGFSIYYDGKPKSGQHSHVIAITQIASHPSLDLIRKGITDELKDNRVFENNKYRIVFENAQGNISTATQIAQKFAGLKPAVIVAITTPSAQTIKSAIKNSKIKMVFSGVTDPIGARLLPDFIDHNNQITGNVDIPPIQDQIKTILKYKPGTKRIGVVYNPGEVNSIKQIDQLKEYAMEAGIDIVQSTASKTVEVGPATERLVGVVDAIYIPNDNTVVSAIESLIKIADKHKILVLASDPESIEKGAHLALANNQYQVGRDTGKLVYRILNGEDVALIPVKATTAEQLFVNKEKLKLIGIKVS